MSLDYGCKESRVDLKLPSNNQNHCVQLNSNLGAGVNATLKAGVTLLAAHSLSELVWSPSRGITVKRADYSLTEQLSANLPSLEPNNMAVSSTKSISSKRIYTDNFVDENKDVTSPGSVNFCVDEVVAPRRGICSMRLDGLIKSQDEDTGAKTGELDTQNVDKKKIFREQERKGKGEKENLGVFLNVNPGIGESQLPGVVSSVAFPSQVGPSCHHNVAPAFVEEEGQSVLKTPGAITGTLDNLEFSAENYLQVEASKCTNLIILNGNNKSCEHHDGTHLVDRSVLIPRNQRIDEQLREVKGKARSDGDVNDQLADDINNHGSAGSCSSRRLASSGKTKRIVDQQLTFTSKRLKKSMGRDPDSAAFIRQSSSFMSWITNMIKGYSGYNENEAPSLMLTHTEPESHSQKRVACHEFSGMGFRNVFQSLYRSDNSEKGTGKIYLTHKKNEGSGDTKHGTMVDVSAVPFTAHRTSDSIPGNCCLSNEIYDLPTSDCVIVSPSKQGMILPASFSTKESNSLFEMNTISCNVAKTMEMAIINPPNSGKGRAHTRKYNDSMYTSKEMAGQATGQKRDYLGSQWVTRFFPRISQPASYKNHHITSKFISKRILSTSENHGSYGKGPMDVVKGEHSFGLRERRNGLAKTEGLVGSGEMKVKYEQQSEYNLEAITSGFARRLDAFKQIIPFDSNFMSAMTTITCFFCGASSHDLRACSKITKSEIEELLQKINSYEKVKESPCLCIICFQVSHWAVECPRRPSRKFALGSFSDWPSDIDLDSNRSATDGKSLLEMNDHSPGTLGPQRTSGEGNFRMDTELIQLGDSCKYYQDIVGARNPNDLESDGLKADESSSPTSSMGLPHKIAVPVNRIFDALRRLRLSRSDFLRARLHFIASDFLNIVKDVRLGCNASLTSEMLVCFVRLVDSHISLSQLRGFYLRVRLRNCKEGSDGKGYHVACIHGAPNEQAGSKTRVMVAVGNFTGLVESQYVSNQDFIEEELLMWWSTTAKAGHSQIPSLEELEQKYQERKRLGF